MSKNDDSEDQKKKICKGCGEPKLLKEFSDRQKSKTCYRSLCKTCRNKKHRLNGALLLHRLCAAFNNAKARAKKGDLEFNLDSDWIKSKNQQQNGACLLTGIPFECPPRHEKTQKNISSPFLPSIDKALHYDHYVQDNCRLVCNVINVAMNTWGLSPVAKMAVGLLTTLNCTIIPPPNKTLDQVIEEAAKF